MSATTPAAVANYTSGSGRGLRPGGRTPVMGRSLGHDLAFQGRAECRREVDGMTELEHDVERLVDRAVAGRPSLPGPDDVAG